MKTTVIEEQRKQQLSVLLDTGAGINIISSDLKQQLGLPMIPFHTPLRGLKSTTTTIGRCVLSFRFTTTGPMHTIPVVVVDTPVMFDIIIGDETLADKWHALIDLNPAAPKITINGNETISLLQAPQMGKRTPITLATAETDLDTHCYQLWKDFLNRGRR
jgi:hypothetical protein